MPLWRKNGEKCESARVIFNQSSEGALLSRGKGESCRKTLGNEAKAESVRKKLTDGRGVA